MPREAQALTVTSGLALEGGLGALEPLYRRVFPGSREPNWFARKLRRQCASAQCTALAHEGSRCTAQSVVGFALAGKPDSCAGWWRTSGIGVAEAHRRQGHGRRLVAHMLELARAAGGPGVRTLAPPWLSNFYASLGYAHEHTDVHLIAQGTAATGSDDIAFGQCSADINIPEDAHRAWTDEAWRLTPLEDRRVIRTDAGLAGLSREAAGWLVQWWAPDHATCALAPLLRKSVGPGTPLILLGVETNPHPTHEALLAQGWDTLETREHHRWITR